MTTKSKPRIPPGTVRTIHAVAVDVLAEYGIRGPFCVYREPRTGYCTLECTDPKDTFIYELRGGDKVVLGEIILTQWDELTRGLGPTPYVPTYP